MGAYSPAPVLTAELEDAAMERIILPTVRAMANAGTPFSGVLFAGLMLTADGPQLIEYNVRFGDPECEAIMPRIEGDFAVLLHAVATGALASVPAPSLLSDHVMTVVVAARGYPGIPVKGDPIEGIQNAERVEGVTVFHAGTAAHASGALLAAGGRVLAVTARAPSLRQARDKALAAIDRIDFSNGFHRRDIGWRELHRQDANHQEHA
jgi:phosphoribosylamine--glycine ligase